MSNVSRLMLRRIAIAFGVLLAVIGIGWWADVSADRRYVLAVVSPEPIYSLPPHTYPESNPIVKELTPDQPLRVLRVRYGKDFEAIQVQTPSGQVGWILSGGGVRVLSRG